jgi:hypothetical protein
MMGWALGSLESQLEPHVQTHCISDRSHLLPGGRRLFTLFKPLLRWLSGLRGFRKRASVDCVASPVSYSGAVHRAGYFA